MTLKNTAGKPRRLATDVWMTFVIVNNCPPMFDINMGIERIDWLSWTSGSFMKSHRIYLRQPWSVFESSGGKILQRRFHTPSGLTQTSRVWLILEAVPTPANVQLNGRTINLEQSQQNADERSVYRAEITNLLSTTSNLLAIRLPSREEGNQSGAISKGSEELPSVGGKVYLEIWET